MFWDMERMIMSLKQRETKLKPRITLGSYHNIYIEKIT